MTALLAKTAMGALVAVGLATSASAQVAPDFEGMWSDPPFTALDTFCLFFCSDVGLNYLNDSLSNPANDDRPYQEISGEAARYQIEHYIRPLMTAAALEDFPWDPAHDPGFLNCEPWGFVRQIFAAHQLEIRQHSDRIEMRYGEWDGRRTVYLDGRERPENLAPSSLGFSVGRYEGDTLVIETSAVRANRTLWRAHHSDELRTTERYTRDYDGGRLLLEVVLEDPWSLKEPLRMKKVWRWAPEEEIFPYIDCEPPTDPSTLVSQP